MPSRRKYISKKVRKEVNRLAHSHCEYCQCVGSHMSSPLTVEHIMPIKRGGNDQITNLALACFGCNLKKNAFVEAIDPVSRQVVPLFHPRTEQWTDHFKWSEDYTLIIGQTATGRASIDKLQLNRSGIVNLRRVFILVNIHPPKHTLPT